MFYVTGQLYQFERSEYYYLFGPQTANLHNNWYKKAFVIAATHPRCRPFADQAADDEKFVLSNLHKINIERTYFFRSNNLRKKASDDDSTTMWMLMRRNYLPINWIRLNVFYQSNVRLIIVKRELNSIYRPRLVIVHKLSACKSGINLDKQITALPSSINTTNHPLNKGWESHIHVSIAVWSIMHDCLQLLCTERNPIKSFYAEKSWTNNNQSFYRYPMERKNGGKKECKLNCFAIEGCTWVTGFWWTPSRRQERTFVNEKMLVKVWQRKQLSSEQEYKLLNVGKVVFRECCRVDGFIKALMGALKRS